MNGSQARDPENTAVDLFGGNSDGGMRMSEWLEVMCLGCRHESVKYRTQGAGGGFGCELPERAICHPYTAEMPEWSVDASPRPERLAKLGDGPWPVCLNWEPRTKRSDAGVRRGPRVSGMEPLFEMERAG